MAAGWWKTSHDNLALGSPVDFTVTTSPDTPRNWGKLTQVCASGGFYLGGTPCVTIDNVIYFAGDTYTQGTDKPAIYRYDGRLATKVIEIPYITGTTPAKAILSLCHDDTNDAIYVSSWDAGTTSTTFSGRVFKYNITTGSIAAFGDDVFSSGKLPLTLALSGTKLFVGTTAQDPTKHAFIYTIDTTSQVTTADKVFQTGEISAPVISSVTRATSTYTYKVTTVTSGGAESGSSAAYSVTNDPDLDVNSYNTVVTGALPTGATSIKYYRTAGEATTGVIATTSAETLQDTGLAGSGASAPAAAVTAVSPLATCSFLASAATTYQYAVTLERGGLVSDAKWSTAVANGPNSQGPGSNNVNINVTLNFNDALTTVRIYRAQGPGATGLIQTLTQAPNLPGNVLNVFDNVANGDGSAIPAPAPPAITLVTPTDPTTTTSYVVTANTANGETTVSSTSSTSAKATLSASSKVTVSWGAVGGATSYNLYRTVGHTSTGKIVSATGATSAIDTGLVASGSQPTVNTSGDPIGGVGCMVVYNDDLYVGLYQEATAFATVQKRANSGGAWTVSNTIAPGGTAGAYNGFAGGIVFNSNLYMAYWNDDATDIALIRKYTGSAWSTVKTLTGANARPIIAFCEVEGKLWAYGGGDGSTGILYQSSTDGATWTDQSALLPSSKEAIPFMGNVNVLGGF